KAVFEKYLNESGIEAGELKTKFGEEEEESEEKLEVKTAG
ncbi:MAG: DNA ligase-associated DEXH box helicase, partial [Pedobacter sp.]